MAASFLAVLETPLEFLVGRLGVHIRFDSRGEVRFVMVAKSPAQTDLFHLGRRESLIED